jgi:hypothetical protein
MNVAWVGLFIICLNGSEILIIFRTGSEKPRKLAKSLKIFSPEPQMLQVN